MTWKRWSIILTLVAASLATLTTPAANAQVASAFGFDQVPLSGPPGTLVSFNGRGCNGPTVGIRLQHATAGAPVTTFSVNVAANGTWSARNVNMPDNFILGRFNIQALCNGPGSPVAFGAFDMVDALAVRPDAIARSSPSVAAVRGRERLDLVVRDASNAIQWSTNGGGGWSPYTSLGSPPGGAKGDPSIVSWAPDRLDLFVQGADNKLWQRFSTNGGGVWSAWIQPVGTDGTLASGPEAASRGPGLLDVVVTGIDGRVYQRFWDGRQWNDSWLRQGAPGGGTPTPPPGAIGTPTAVSPDGVRLDLIARDSANLIWLNEWNGSAWSGWNQPVGLHTGAAASRLDVGSWGPGHLSALVQGTDGWLYHSIFQAPSWSNFQRVGFFHQKVVDGPGVASRGFGRLDIVVRGVDDRLYHWTIG